MKRTSASRRPLAGLSCSTLALVLAVGLAGCGHAALKPAAHDDVAAAYVLLGEDGAVQARAITHGSTCPSIVVDGTPESMTMRAAPATLAPRARGKNFDPKPVAFPVASCEKLLPAQTRSASIDGHALPLPVAAPTRIVVIGDTGCRLKTGDPAQACNDPDQYAFRKVALAAARWKPDLVVHVGDYLYRENPCPADASGCAGSPWGYGWDSWDADLFAPGSALLQAAPWVASRGNHESCSRAGQGWWRFLDTHPLLPKGDCNDAANDDVGDYAEPFAVPLGNGAQLVVLDTSNTIADAITPNDAVRTAKYLALHDALERLAARQPHTITVNHQPILGLAGKQDKHGGAISVFPSSYGLASLFAQRNAALLPASVDAMLAGHTHLWEQLDFGGKYPSQFIAGFSGTEEDVVPMPETLPADAMPAPGAKIDASSSWLYGFGFMTMERRSEDHWHIEVHGLDGKVVNDCELVGKQSRCRLPQVK